MDIRIIRLALKEHLAVHMIRNLAGHECAKVLQMFFFLVFPSHPDNHIIDRPQSEFTHTKNISFEHCQWPYFGWQENVRLYMSNYKLSNSHN